jgi:type VI secretion system protein ImpJ
MFPQKQSSVKLASKVVWSEGMYVGPHHFQGQSRYFENLIQFAASSLWFEPYGITGAELDPEALHNGTACVLHARGVFPDGLPFNMPETDALPEPRSINDLFPAERDAITILLGVPRQKPQGLNCVLDGAEASDCPDARYIAELRVMHDDNNGGDERPIQVGRKNLRLLLDTEPSDDLLSLPLARIIRDGSGHFSYDPHFVPPVLQISASQRLMLLGRRLVEVLEEKASAIGQSRPTSGAEFFTREIANFWILHAVNSAAATLGHLVSAKRGHPEELFVELLRLAGALCTFRLGSHPRGLPLYDHRNLGACFDALDQHIREHLEIIVPTNCISIPLTPAGDCFYEGEITDQRCIGRSRWVLAVRAAMGDAELMVKTPQLVKVCSPQFVRELVKRALPGLALKHLAVPPPAISPGVEKQYFGISRGGPCWDHMVQTKRVGVYIPGDIPNPEAQILVVLDQS